MPKQEKIGLGVDEEPKDEIVNDSLGTIDPADTTNTDPADINPDDPESKAKGKGIGRKGGAV